MKKKFNHNSKDKDKQTQEQKAKILTKTKTLGLGTTSYWPNISRLSVAGGTNVPFDFEKFLKIHLHKCWSQGAWTRNYAFFVSYVKLDQSIQFHLSFLNHYYLKHVANNSLKHNITYMSWLTTKEGKSKESGSSSGFRLTTVWLPAAVFEGPPTRTDLFLIFLSRAKYDALSDVLKCSWQIAGKILTPPKGRCQKLLSGFYPLRGGGTPPFR